MWEGAMEHPWPRGLTVRRCTELVEMLWFCISPLLRTVSQRGFLC